VADASSYGDRFGDLVRGHHSGGRADRFGVGPDREHPHRRQSHARHHHGGARRRGCRLVLDRAPRPRAGAGLACHA
jgi:hypothetical protein